MGQWAIQSRATGISEDFDGIRQGGAAKQAARLLAGPNLLGIFCCDPITHSSGAWAFHVARIPNTAKGVTLMNAD